jgi:hypothetical protein
MKHDLLVKSVETFDKSGRLKLAYVCNIDFRTLLIIPIFMAYPLRFLHFQCLGLGSGS